MPRKGREQASLLSNRGYDDDAASVNSADADESDLNEETSSETARDDEAIFEDDYERSDKEDAGQPSGVSRFFRRKSTPQDGSSIPLRDRRKPSRKHRERRKRHDEAESEVVYEMEEGGQPSQSPSRSSSESDLKMLGVVQASASARRKKRFGDTMMYLGVVLLCVGFVYGAYRATWATRRASIVAVRSNGTSEFLPTTIVISLDGFRADFLQRGITPNMNAFIASGVSPLYMLPSFPSVTFPNHYTMLTGLYPESHGIVGNTFWDPELKEEFFYSHTDNSMQPKWWGGEPLWVTAELQGIKTAIHMWPGSEAHIMGIEPSHIDKYYGKERLDKKVDRMLELIDLPGPDSPRALEDNPRPQFIAAYVPVVDSDGHLYGPNSTEIHKSITDVDNMLGSLFIGLEQRNLTEVVNVIVVSDHGMATTDLSRLVQLEDLVNLDEIEHVDGWPLYGLRPKRMEDLERIYQQVKNITANNPNLEVYLRDKDMPERYHFSNNDRIAPLWIIPKAGWAVVMKKDFDVEEGKKKGLVYHPRGIHGYDHEHPLMRAIFMARGPAFRHKPGSRVEVFQNTQVYNIICDSIGLSPMPNNGTLRLPLKSTGLHTDPNAPKLERPADPPEHASAAAGGQTATFAAIASSEPVFGIATAPATPPTATQDSGAASPTRPTIEHDGDPKDAPKGSNAWLQWLEDEWEVAKEKVGDLFGHKDPKPPRRS